MEQTLKDVLIEREHWNLLDSGQVAASIGLVNGQTCFVPYTLAMKKIFPNQNLPITRVIYPKLEVRFSEVLCEDKFFLGLVEKIDQSNNQKFAFEPRDFPWNSFMQIIEVAQQYFVVERKNQWWKINNLALVNVREIYLREPSKA